MTFLHQDNGRLTTIGAMICVGFSYFIFNNTDVVIKTLVQNYPPFQILVLNNIVVLCIAVLLCLKKYGRKAFECEKWKLHLLRGTVFNIMVLFVLEAFKDTPLANFYGIFFSGPFFALILANVFLKEKIDAHHVTALLVGFLGVLVIAVPGFETFGIGTFYVIIAAMLNAIGLTITKKIGYDSKPEHFGLFPALSATFLFTPFLFYFGLETPSFTAIGLHGLAGILIFFAVMLIGYGFAHAPKISQVLPLHYTQIIWGALFGYLYFGDIPSIYVYPGAALVIAANIYIIKHPAKHDT